MENLILKNESLNQEVRALSFSLSRKEVEFTSLTDHLAMHNGTSVCVFPLHNSHKPRSKASLSSSYLMVTIFWYLKSAFRSDKLQFSRDLLARGFEGGEEAASGLVALVSKRLSLSHSTRVLVHVFAQCSVLAAFLAQAGIISRPDAFTDFVAGFNSKEELCTFVDVGKGKEATCSKISGIIS
jgi:hypothetical protein